MRKKPVSTLGAVAREIRRARTIGDAEKFLSSFVERLVRNETYLDKQAIRVGTVALREKDAEVRRLRRALREIVRQDTPPKNAVPEVCWECGDQITEGENIDDAILCCYRCTAAQHATMAYTAHAALAPRKGRKK